MQYIYIKIKIKHVLQIVCFSLVQGHTSINYHVRVELISIYELQDLISIKVGLSLNNSKCFSYIL